MKNKIVKIGKFYLVTGLVFTQFSNLDVFSSTAYAIVDKNIPAFTMSIDKDTKKVNEEVIVTIESLNSEERIIEFLLPDGADFSEEVTKKLNMENVMIDAINVVGNSRIRIEKKESNNALGKVFIAAKMTKSGDFEFGAKSQNGNTEMKRNKIGISVLNDVKETSDKKHIEQAENSLVEQTEAINENPIVIKESEDISITQKGLSESEDIANNEVKTKEDTNEKSPYIMDENIYDEKTNKSIEDGNVHQVELDRKNIENPVVADKKEERDIPLTEYAAGSYQSILKYPNVKVINERTGEGPTISGKYAFQLRWSPDVSYEVSGEDRTYSTYYRFTSGNANKKSYVLIKNVGFYNGSWMDLRINVLDISSGYIKIYKPTTRRDADDFLRVNYNGSKGSVAKLSYEFINHKTGDKTRVSSMWNFKRLNSYKSIDLRTDGSYLSNLYTYDTTAIAYKDNGNSTSNFVGTVGGEKLNTNMSITFDEIDELPVRLNLEKTVGYLKYDRDAISKVELPAPDVEGNTTEDDSREMTYYIYQNVPSQSSTSYYAKSLSIESEVDKSFKLKNVEITDEEHNDVSKFFDVTIKNNKIIATAKANVIGTSQFNDKFYRIKVTGSIVENTDFMKYYKNGYLEIPVVAKNYVDGDKKGQTSNQDITKIKYKGIPTGEAVPQTVKVGTDISKMDISKFVTNLSVDTNAKIDKPISVVRLEDIPKTDTPGNYTVTAIIKTKQGVEAKVKVPIKIVEGTLKLVDVPKVISFHNLVMPSKPTIYAPSLIDGKVTVVDARAKKQKWRLGVKEIKPLTSSYGDQLIGAMVYTDKKGINHTLSMENTEVLSHTLKDDNDYDVSWNQNQGIRLQVAPGPNVKAKTKYKGKLQWTLTDAPI
ncbi:adhesive domain-containing protein [Bacillus mobilis]|uniref:adhesive domain-containing protein n=1 Tax=Bacillus mobilis TaxID=2026190 RepID=UPI0008FDD565|nr:adhesive domain-containing protein [Bacillus mobilis]MDG1622614.1 WxL domain-containing protein [Bacillus mobilis]OJE38895.1 cell surface protein [Bacillus mobilis]HDR7244026.1 cell surface protein [Bacillus mobilis]